MRAVLRATPHHVVILAAVLLSPCRGAAQQPAAPNRRPNAVITGTLVTDSGRPIARDTVFCTLLRQGVAPNPRAATDAGGRFTIVIDSALFPAGGIIPGGTCILGVYRGGPSPYRALEAGARHSGIIVVAESSLRAAAASGVPVDVGRVVPQPD